MANEKSAGAVIFHRGEQIEYLLLFSRYWGFSKGLVESGEDERTTALREIREESGLDVTLVDGFRHVDEYWYQRKGERIHKQAVYLLAEAATRRVKLSWEHEDSTWLPFDQAQEKLQYAGLRQVLAEANRFLQEHDKKASRAQAKRKGE